MDSVAAGMALQKAPEGCEIKQVPQETRLAASAAAIAINPTNRVSPATLLRIVQTIVGDFMGLRRILQHITPDVETTLQPDHLALLTTKYWGAKGVDLTVSFPFDSPPADLQARIVQHMNAWGEYCNAVFHLTNDPGAQVRVSRSLDGYWSYLGTDILSIPASQPTMNLASFTMQTPESEFHRVVRHETGHTLGYPHEHMRSELIARLDRQKTILYFQQTQGWSPQMTTQQVLTPLSAASIRGTPHADQDSIMTYHLPGSITIDGQPIRGGSDIDQLDAQFAASIYPKTVVPNPPPNPPVPPSPPQPNGGSVLAKILALIQAVKNSDWISVLRIISDLFADKQAGRITEADFVYAESALACTMASAPKQR